MQCMASPWDGESAHSSVTLASQQAVGEEEAQALLLSDDGRSTDARSTMEFPKPQTPRSDVGSQRSLESTASRAELGPPLTNGPVQIVTVNNGDKECLALLLSHDLIGKLNAVLQGMAKVDGLRDRSEACNTVYDMMEMRAADTKQELIELEALRLLPEEQSEGKLDSVDEELTNLRESLKRLQENQKLNEAGKEQADRDLDLGLMYQRSRLDSFLGILTTAMEGYPLIEDLSPDVESDKGSMAHEPETLDDSTTLSLERLNIESTKEEFKSRRNTVRWLQGQFDGRRDAYYQDLADYEKAKEDGECESIGMSEFDRRFVFASQQLTHDLAEAEEAFRDVTNRANALHIQPTELAEMDSGMEWPEPDYDVDDIDEVQEAQAIASVNRSCVEGWAQHTADTGNLGPDEEEDRVADEWDVESLIPGDSISQVAEPYWRAEIDRWRSRCSDLRSSMSLDE
ncbi:MAG: hypothetical protein M1835_000261 [Candelina submexicana]|nr:MAG: hypothetical protein M1835_000261 [Candelina submexicana]